jgi:hypothetical protein
MSDQYDAKWKQVADQLPQENRWVLVDHPQYVYRPTIARLIYRTGLDPWWEFQGGWMDRIPVRWRELLDI